MEFTTELEALTYIAETNADIEIAIGDLVDYTLMLEKINGTLTVILIFTVMIYFYSLVRRWRGGHN